MDKEKFQELLKLLETNHRVALRYLLEYFTIIANKKEDWSEADVMIINTMLKNFNQTRINGGKIEIDYSDLVQQKDEKESDNDDSNVTNDTDDVSDKDTKEDKEESETNTDVNEKPTLF